jgi:hypothetical protein
LHKPAWAILVFEQIQYYGPVAPKLAGVATFKEPERELPRFRNFRKEMRIRPMGRGFSATTLPFFRAELCLTFLQITHFMMT